jgi:coenzyme F420-reducing hydrogenase gamma subunit
MANAFSIAENWIAKNYNSANNVIQQKDKDNGIIVVKGLTPFTISDGLVSENRNVNYTMEIRVKDNKSKIVIDLGVIAAEGNFSAPPECAPPSNEMPKIISAFEKIKNGLNTEWNSSINASDF